MNTTPVVCSWCTVTMVAGVGPISHGICPECQAIYFPKKKDPESVAA